jgi:hypothetical protein
LPALNRALSHQKQLIIIKTQQINFLEISVHHTLKGGEGISRGQTSPAEEQLAKKKKKKKRKDGSGFFFAFSFYLYVQTQMCLH